MLTVQKEFISTRHARASLLWIDDIAPEPDRDSGE
jgi:hypothetical protein